jgi:hypothetical protein
MVAGPSPCCCCCMLRWLSGTAPLPFAFVIASRWMELFKINVYLLIGDGLGSSNKGRPAELCIDRSGRKCASWCHRIARCFVHTGMHVRTYVSIRCLTDACSPDFFSFLNST